jgi:membrane protease YdiL (CAAX protease family)
LASLLAMFSAALGAAIAESLVLEEETIAETSSLAATAAFVLAVCFFGWRVRGELGLLLRPASLKLSHVIPTVLAAAVLALVVAPYLWLATELGFPAARYLPFFDEDGAATIWTFVRMCTLVPIAEEIAFRGFTLFQLERVLAPREALIVQAVLFAALHFSAVSIPSHFVIGVVFGVLRQKTGSLYPPILLHALWNGAVLWLETLE